MDLSSLLNITDKKENSIIQKDMDPVKYDEMLQKLCEKRKGLEKDLLGETLDATAREEKALKLIEIKKGMTLFGISEIDYQAYLHRNERVDEVTPPTEHKNTDKVALVDPD